MRRETTWLMLAASAFAIGAWGCGDAPPSVSSSAEEVQVKGKVTYKGKELLKAKVQFETANIARPDAPTFTFDVQDDGSFAGTTLIGENNVSVVPPPNTKGAFPPYRETVTLTAGENTVNVDIPAAH
ncbi:hypothetical protein [Paludisphaera sp.]|uniref:hypothetical protein n=1 Tax=Paludisphaera sp. TaxID=2017432 RepID=UPI00301E573A